MCIVQVLTALLNLTKLYGVKDATISLASQCFDRCVAITARVHGRESLEHVETVLKYAEFITLKDSQRHAEVEGMYRSVLPILERHFGRVSARYAEALAGMSNVYADLGRHRDRMPYLLVRCG